MPQVGRSGGGSWGYIWCVRCRGYAVAPLLAEATAPLAANQGLYNGFLAAGLIWGLMAAGPVGDQVLVFFLICVIVAGVYGAVTANRRILIAQALPGALALTAVLIAGQV